MSSITEHAALERLVADGTLTPQQAQAVEAALAGVVPATASPAVLSPAVLSPAGSSLAGSSPAGSSPALPSPDVPSPPTEAPAPRTIGERAAARPTWTTVVAEVGGYVGGAFVMAAAVVLTGPRWSDFGTAARLAILGLPALVLLVAAAGVLATTAGGWPVHDRRGAGPRRRLFSALALVVAGLAGGVTLVGVGDPGTWDAVLWTGTALGVLAVAYAACRTPLLHVATAAATAALAQFVVGTAMPDWRWTGVWIGVALLGVAAGWLALTVTGLLDEAALGLTVAAVVAFVGGEVIALQDRYEWGGFLSLAVLAVAGLVGYVRTRHVGVLVVGVVALATVVPQGVIHYTDGALGAAGALLVTGLSILAASVLGLRLRGTTQPVAAHPEH
jgi:hypothetical protein